MCALSSSPSTFPCATEGPDWEVARICNGAAIALNLLYTAGDSGSGAAREKLGGLSDKVIEATGKCDTPGR
jgi:hypothetical protein